MSRLTRHTDVAASAQRVWALLEDVRRLPEYSASTLEVRDAPDRITAVGQTYTQVGRLLGKRYSSTWTVTAFEPGRLITSDGTIGLGIGYRLTQLVESRSETATRLSIFLDYTVPGGALGRLAARAGIEQRAGHEIESILTGIAEALEH